ncbi:MAG: hypothetical protein ACYC9O_19315, partial [Candidatus Latescibacterota bacterium]
FTLLDMRFYAGITFGAMRYPVLALNRLFYLRTLNRVIMSDRYYQGFLSFLECFTVIVAR